MRFRPYFRGGRKSGFHCTKILWFFTQFAFKNQTVRNVLKFLYKAVNLIFFSLNPFLEALLKYRVKSDNQDSLETVTKDSKNGDKWHKDGLNLRHDTEMRRYNSKLPSPTWLPPWYVRIQVLKFRTETWCSPPKRASFFTPHHNDKYWIFSLVLHIYISGLSLQILLCFNFQTVIEQYNYKGMLKLQVKARQH